MDYQGIIACKVNEAREGRGMSVAWLARAAGIDEARLWRIMKGRSNLLADELVRLCAVLDLPMMSLAPRDLLDELEAAREGIVEDFGRG